MACIFHQFKFCTWDHTGGATHQIWRGGTILITNDANRWHGNIWRLIAEISITNGHAGADIAVKRRTGEHCPISMQFGCTIGVKGWREPALHIGINKRGQAAITRDGDAVIPHFGIANFGSRVAKDQGFGKIGAGVIQALGNQAANR